MPSKITFLAGAAVGYVLGARAGRQRYEQLSELGSRVAAAPPVQKAKDAAEEQVTHLAEQAKRAVGEKVGAAVAEGKEKVAEGRLRVVEALGDKVPERFRSGDEPDEYTPTMPSAQTAPGTPNGAGANI